MRKWLHFEIELDTPPLSPTFPAGIEVRPMDLDNDWDIVGPALDEAFSDHWGAITKPVIEVSTFDELDPVAEKGNEETFEDEFYSNAPGYCFYAWSDGQVASGILCNVKLVERPDTGRVGSIFVRPAFRRQGLGKALMLTAFGAIWQRGLRRIILDTDAESFTAAPRFYTQLGMHVYRRELLYEKEIRSGLEIRRL